MISKELLSLILNENIVTGKYKTSAYICEESFNTNFKTTIEIIDNEIVYTVLNNSYVEKRLNLDTLGRLCKEWIIKNNNEIINIFNSSSVQGWVCTSSLYNKKIVKETELEAIVALAEFIAKEKELL